MLHKNNYEYYDEEEMETENEILTPHEVMFYLGIGKNTFYRLVNSGELSAFRVGKCWRVSRAFLQEFVSRSKK